jgi:excisionase family DNA binding protein
MSHREPLARAELVEDVGFDEERPEACSEDEEEIHHDPQWIDVLVWRRKNPRTEVWARHQAEQQPDDPLDVRAAGPPVPGDSGVRVVVEGKAARLVRVAAVPAADGPTERPGLAKRSPVPEQVEEARPASPPAKPPRPLPNGMLTIAEVAALLSVARSTVEVIPAEELPFAHVGRGTQKRLRRYRPEDVDAYIARQCAKAVELEGQQQEHAEWARVASSRKRAEVTGTSGSTTRARTRNTASPRTPRTKQSLVNAWLKLRGL